MQAYEFVKEDGTLLGTVLAPYHISVTELVKDAFTNNDVWCLRDDPVIVILVDDNTVTVDGITYLYRKVR